MKTVARLIYASVAVTILSACANMAVNTQCATPTLKPPSGTGHSGDQITVEIETSTSGAYLSWTDDGSQPTPTGIHIIKAPKGYAITVFGRTLKAIAFKTGMTNSSTAQGVYVGTNHKRRGSTH